MTIQTTCTCGEMLRLALVLSSPDVSAAHMADYEAHRATCQICRDTEQAAIEKYALRPETWRTVALIAVDTCPAGTCEFTPCGNGVELCTKCGVVRW